MIGYVLRSLAGGWDVMNGRPEGLDKLDLTIEGFWRSFAVVLLVIPIDVIMLLGDRADRAAQGLPVPPLTLEDYSLSLLAGLVAMIAFLLTAALLARPLGLASRFVPLVVAGNWGGVLIIAAAAVPFLLFLVGILPHAAFDWAIIIVAVPVIAWLYLLVRTALAVRPLFAVAALLGAILIEAPILVLLDPTW